MSNAATLHNKGDAFETFSNGLNLHLVTTGTLKQRGEVSGYGQDKSLIDHVINSDHSEQHVNELKSLRETNSQIIHNKFLMCEENLPSTGCSCY